MGGAEACEGRVHIFWKIEGKVTGMELELVIQMNVRCTVWLRVCGPAPMAGRYLESKVHT